MPSVPISPLAPGAEGYDTVFDRWDLQGRAHYVEHQAEGWLRRAIWPDPSASQPTFVLVASSAGETTADLSSDLSGYGLAMATRQRSFGDRGTLPREAV